MNKIVNEPRIVKSHDVKLDAEYAEWIAEVKMGVVVPEMETTTPILFCTV